jgi:hypothetical protein
MPNSNSNNSKFTNVPVHLSTLLIPNNSSRNILDRYIPEGFTYLKSLKLDLNSNKEFKTEKGEEKEKEIKRLTTKLGKPKPNWPISGPNHD